MAETDETKNGDDSVEIEATLTPGTLLTMPDGTQRYVPGKASYRMRRPEGAPPLPPGEYPARYVSPRSPLEEYRDRFEQWAREQRRQQPPSSLDEKVFGPAAQVDRFMSVLGAEHAAVAFAMSGCPCSQCNSVREELKKHLPWATFDIAPERKTPTPMPPITFELKQDTAVADVTDEIKRLRRLAEEAIARGLGVPERVLALDPYRRGQYRAVYGGRSRLLTAEEIENADLVAADEIAQQQTARPPATQSQTALDAAIMRALAGEPTSEPKPKFSVGDTVVVTDGADENYRREGPVRERHPGEVSADGSEAKQDEYTIWFEDGLKRYPENRLDKAE